VGEKKTDAGYDYTILIPVFLLTALGLVIVYSASSHLAAHRLGDSYFYFKRQGLFCITGLILMMLTKQVPCSWYVKLAYPLIAVSFCLLILLLIPGLAADIGGASRWFRFAGFSFQPSEFAKFSLAIYLAYSMSKKGSQMESFSKGLLPHMLIAGVFVLLIVLQPDLGTALIIGCWMSILLFVAGARMVQLLVGFIAASPIVVWLIMNAEYRIKRWWAFMNPWDDPQGIGFQIVHSFLAFGSGGIFGVGLGNSKQKLFYLPEPHTDFIFSILAEELGFIGVSAVIILFGVLIARGIKVGLNAKDLYSTYLALALTSLLALQVLVNLGVVMGLMPTKGLTLPFVSYGGSSLLINLLAMGILLNISSRS
jgi:cell division protein FtsW